MSAEGKTAHRTSDAIEGRPQRQGRLAAIACSWFVLLAFGLLSAHVRGVELKVTVEVQAEAAFSTVEGRETNAWSEQGLGGRGCGPAGVPTTQCHALFLT